MRKKPGLPYTYMSSRRYWLREGDLVSALPLQIGLLPITGVHVPGARSSLVHANKCSLFLVI